MYRRFLNNNDYLGLITPEALAQLTRGNEERFLQAEESAEKSLVERLSENYEVEQEWPRGNTLPHTTGALPIPWVCISIMTGRSTRSSVPSADIQHRRMNLIGPRIRSAIRSNQD